MNRDPKWIGLALKAYDACLPLYPREVREAHGEEMRQAFRDRCREVARGQRGAWQWFGEMAPDLIGSAARAHVDVGGKSDRRVLPGLLLLALLAAALATQSRWSIATTDAIKSVGHGVDVALAAREWNREREFVRETTDALVAQGDQESLAVAALLQRAQFDQHWLDPVLWQDENVDASLRRHLPEAGARATALAAPLFTGHASLPALAISAQACSIAAGCNEDLAIRRWLARDPDNAYPWMMAFKRASRHGDEAGMQAALAGIAKARYAQTHVAAVQRDLFARVIADHPGDREALAQAALQFRAMQGVLTDDLQNDVVVHCSLRPQLYGKPRWIDEHPEARPGCMHLAGLLAASTDAFASQYGWRQLQRSGIEMTPARTQALRDATWLYRTVTWRVGGGSAGPGERAQPWTLEQWTRWNAAWAPGDGELPALRRWLQAQSLAVHAPADYDPGN